MSWFQYKCLDLKANCLVPSGSHFPDPGLLRGGARGASDADVVEGHDGATHHLHLAREIRLSDADVTVITNCITCNVCTVLDRRIDRHIQIAYCMACRTLKDSCIPASFA